MEQQKMMVYVFAAFAVFVLAMNSLFIVKQTETAMVLALGKVQRLIETPGVHAKIPFYENLVMFDQRVLDADSPPEEVQTLDKERVVVDSFTRWKIANAGTFYKNVRTVPQAVQRLDTIINSNIREQVALVSLTDLVGVKRTDVMRAIAAKSAEEAEPMGIRIVDVRLKSADLPQANSEAVFKRMRAERQKEAAQLRAEGEEEAQKIRASAERERTVILAEAKRDAQKLWGEGEAQATRITGAAFNRDPGFYALTKSLETYKTAFDPSNTLMVVDPGSALMRVLVNP